MAMDWSCKPDHVGSIPTVGSKVDNREVLPGLPGKTYKLKGEPNMKLREEIAKIQGERQADVRIKACLSELADRIDGGSKCCKEEDDTLDIALAETTALADKVDELEQENDELRAELTALAETKDVTNEDVAESYEVDDDVDSSDESESGTE